jgi:integrase
MWCNGFSNGWLPRRSVPVAEPLFALKTTKGHFRKTSKMMRKDLELARDQWIKEGRSEVEWSQRVASDFLKYENDDGLFADFHANRHSFVSNLARAGVPLTIAQKLARHSDPRLTANRYTHL